MRPVGESKGGGDGDRDLMSISEFRTHGIFRFA